ncbi:MAG: hypothetical protein BWY83_02766 [bacterium ADurb.Bin478]|nr:MAG: hypothetical protein BWY83_02766 [bacterium ADurb.Bin478]
MVLCPCEVDIFSRADNREPTTCRSALDGTISQAEVSAGMEGMVTRAAGRPESASTCSVVGPEGLLETL